MTKYIYCLFLILFLTGCEVFIKEDSVNDNKIAYQDENNRRIR
jgi:PBP1b-binding outer membrane lipoprotein LpoB